MIQILLVDKFPINTLSSMRSGMKNIALGQQFMLAAVFFLLALTAGCQEEKPSPAAEKTEAASKTTPAPAAKPAADQGAPIPNGGKLEILLLGPSGELKKLSQITAMFNQPMIALGDYANVPENAMKIEPPLEGDFKWLNQYTLAFIPKEPIEGSLELRVNVPAGIKALSGAVLEESREIDISLPRLGVLNTFSAGGPALDEESALKPSWQVVFNQKPDLDSLKSKAFFFYRDGDKDVRIAAELEDLNKENNNRQRYSYKITAKEKLPKNTNYQLVLEEGVQSLSGPLPSERIVVQASSTFGPLNAKIESSRNAPVDPASGVYVYFSNPVKESDAARAIRLDNDYDLTQLQKPYSPDENAAEAAPAREGEEDVSEYQTYFYIPAGFKPETQYTVTFSEDLTDVFGQKLGQSPGATFTTGQYETYVRLDEQYGLMETSTEAKTPIILSNIEGAQVQGYALTAEEAVRLMSAAGFSPDYYSDPEKGREILQKKKPAILEVTPPEGAKYGPRLMPVDLAAMFGDKLKGHLLYLQSSWTVRQDEGEQQRSTYALLQISDIGLAVKTAPDGGLVWATNLAEGRSWPKVTVQVLTPEGKSLWKGATDENGLARLPGSTRLMEKSGGETNLFIVATAEGQMSIWNINWNGGLEPWRWNVNFGPALAGSTEKSHWLLNALPLYKPGETAQFKLIAREKSGDQIKDMAGRKLKMTVSDGAGKVVEETTLSTDTYGTFSHKLEIPEDAALGYWSVNVGPEGAENVDYAGSFMVMTYRAPAFEIKMGELPEKAITGDTVEVTIEAAYHFGAPVSAQPAYYSINSSPAFGFSLPGLSEYNFVNNFSDADEYDDSGYGYQEPSTTVASDETTVDGEGRLKLDLNLAPIPGRKPMPRNYTTYFSVTDVDQRQVSTNASFMVHPAGMYVGLAADNFLGTAGNAYAVKAIVADLDGKLIKDRKIKATLYRRTWQNVRRKTPGSGYEYVSRVVDEKAGQAEAVSGAMPSVLEFAPEKAGYYWVLAEIEDEKGRPNQASWSFFVTGDGPVGWHMSNDDRLTLVADKKEYKPGDVAKIMVQSPFSEGQGLLTVERGGVREARIFTIENQTPTLEVPLTDEDTPNIFVSVLLTRGRIADKPDEKGVDLGKPAIRLGYAELKIPSTRELLTVEVTPSQKEIGPGDEVEVSVAVKDNQGQPFSQAEVALIAADAAVVQLSGDDTYYPDRLFMADQPLSVLTADNLVSLIGRRNWSLKGANPGGGGADMARAAKFSSGDDADVRRFFASLAYFNPNMTLDKEGRAKVTIKMPENLTTFKIYAVATGHGRKSGTGLSSVLVTRDLLARSALPGYAGVGDKFAAAMVISNRGQNSGEAKVSLSGENFTLQDGETSEKTVSISPGESREVAFNVLAGEAGQARFTFRVSLGDESDAAEYVIKVIPPNKLVTQASYEQLEPGEKRVALAVPGDIDPGRGSLELELAPSLVGVLTEPFQWLAEYPHACIEQQTSKAWGDLLWLELKDRFKDGQNEDKEAKARQSITEHIQRLSQWESGGGYTLWPGDYDWKGRSVYLTAYNLEFVLAARDMGFKLPYDDFDKRLGSFLFDSLKADFNWPEWYSQQAISESKSYALAALSRAQLNVASYIENMYQNRDKLSLVELINLIRAVGWQPKGGGQAGQLRELLALMHKHLLLTAGEAQFVDNNPGAPELWSTPVRNTARILETLCLVAPHNNLVPALVRNLVVATRNSSGHFGSTQNNVAALSALAAYIKTLEPENPDLSITALLGETTLAEAAFKSFTDAPVLASQPASAIPLADPAVVYQTEGKGQAWASLKMKTAPKAPDLSADTSGGFMLSRSFTVVKPEEGPAGVEQFSRGDVVRVSVVMMVPAPRHSVVMEDRVPAGFEPINFNLADADMTLMGLAEADNTYGRSRYWYNHQEIWPDRVAVYANYLRPGVYTFSYLAKAITPGTYVTPGPQAEEMYSPETYGRGQGQTLTVE
ncbi:hypothetical protein C4J81_11175 [Deltaproteobacteria bacterium Smac51]|nr:hypothetical protein C4J81_11175 [Deltaproteobacteria bacterium Smac51]